MRWFLFPVVTATRKFMQAATNILVREFIFWNLTIPTPSGGQRLSITEFITLDKYHQTISTFKNIERVLIQQRHSIVLLKYKKYVVFFECKGLFYWKIHESCFWCHDQKEALFFSNLYIFSMQENQNLMFVMLNQWRSGVYINFLIDVIQAL